MTPAQAHISLLLSFSAGMFPINTVGAPATQGPAGTGMHGIGVSTPSAEPRYAPNGTALAFVSNSTGKRELWRMAANGDGQLALGLISQHISDPSWSPDGSEIVYTGCLNDACNLYALSVDGSRARQLTSRNFNDWQPDWSAFGIVFASNRGDAKDLWLVNANGANLRALTTPVGTGDLYPRWDRSGTVVFVRCGVAGEPASGNVRSYTASGGEQQLTRLRDFMQNGDANSDGLTNCADLALVKASFDKRQGQAGYDSRADMNGDLVVNRPPRAGPDR